MKNLSEVANLLLPRIFIMRGYACFPCVIKKLMEKITVGNSLSILRYVFCTVFVVYFDIYVVL